MPRYSKNHSNYVLKKKHQTINGGTIFERDWVTIGGLQNFGKGKSIRYYDGNFIFTESSVPNFQKRHRLNSTTDIFTYDDVKNAVGDVNIVKVNKFSDDLRDYAYYGSCVELVRSTIESIISEFPANITLTKNEIEVPPTTSDGLYTTLTKKYGYIINNPFNIDLYHKDVSLSKYDNEMRFLSLSYDKYLLNGSEITGYDVIIDVDSDCPQNDQWYIKKAPIITVKLNGKNVFYGFKVNETILFTSNENNLTLMPKDEVIVDYFDNLDGFERLLLRQDTKPFYKNTFITPIEGELNYKYVKRDYTWPSNGYCVDITSTSYYSFVERLLKTAQTLDELWTDNLYRNMTHEAIKNFDWTYTRDYIDGEEQDNIDGGERMQKILHVYGRVFDDIKRNIDGIKISNTVSYSSYNNMPSAMISDTLNDYGWDMVSTIPSNSNLNLPITTSFLSKKKLNWYKSHNNEEIFPQTCDVEFNRRLMLSTKRIMQTKGTKNSIDMIMAMFGFGDGDYTMEEQIIYTKPLSGNLDDNLEKIERINSNKSLSRVDDDVFAGIPLKLISFKNKEYIVPYYEKDKYYDGEFAFQTNGGWGKKIGVNEDVNNEKGGFNYIETISYMHVVSSITSLLDTNTNSVKNGDIYYVTDISDYIHYNEREVDINNLTHYFKMNNNRLPNKLASWENVPVDNPKVVYLESIINTNIANNPHVGYGKYDDGDEFFQYMEKPFKYSIEKYKLEYSDLTDANNIKFDLTKELFDASEDDRKIIINNDDSTKYHLNSKIFVLKNVKMQNNDLFNNYFREVILPYVMQVIPSTAILILKGF